MTTTKKVLIVVTSVVVLGGLGYWAYRYYDKKSLQDSSPDSTNGSNDSSNPPVPTETNTTTTPGTVSESTPIGSGRDTRSTTSPAPAPTPTPTNLSTTDIAFIVRVFQNWMDKNHPNWVKMANGSMGNLNQKTTLGYGNFGPQTKASLKKYKTDFSNFLMSISLFGIKPNRDAVRKFFNYTAQFGI